MLTGRSLAALLAALPAWLRSRRWYGAKARRTRSIALRDVIPLPEVDGLEARLALLEIEYVEGEADLYALPLALADPVRAERLRLEAPGTEIALLPDGRVLYDAFVDPQTGAALLSLLDRGRRVHGKAGSLGGVRTSAYRAVRGSVRDKLPVAPIKAEQSNTSVIFGDRLILKLYRRVEPGINPDFEIGRLLTEHHFPHIPPVAGALEYRPTKGESITLGILQAFVPNESDAWNYTLDSIDQAYDRALESPDIPMPAPPSVARLLEVGRTGVPGDGRRSWVGPYLASARLLGVRTAEMHLALATASDDPAFRPEPINSFFQRSMYQGTRTQLRETMALLSRRRDLVPAADSATVDEVLGLEGALLARLRDIISGPLDGVRIRIHGDYHAGQVLWTGSDFVIIDFEGEPGRPLGERRLKRSPLRDVAGMLRSFHYAAYGTLLTDGLASATRPEDVPRLQPWARLWYESVAATFLRRLPGRRGRLRPAARRRAAADHAAGPVAAPEGALRGGLRAEQPAHLDQHSPAGNPGAGRPEVADGATGHRRELGPAAQPTERLADITADVVVCRMCPRLVEWRELVAREKVARFAAEPYWGRPVPGFGDPQARVLLVGLAPAAHGGNRTGRVFTGDNSGNFLFPALFRAGFANQPTSVNVTDGLRLRDLYVAAVNRSAPPDNKPTPEERDNCLPYLVREMVALPKATDRGGPWAHTPGTACSARWPRSACVRCRCRGSATAPRRRSATTRCSAAST